MIQKLDTSITILKSLFSKVFISIRDILLRNNLDSQIMYLSVMSTKNYQEIMNTDWKKEYPKRYSNRYRCYKLLLELIVNKI